MIEGRCPICGTTRLLEERLFMENVWDGNGIRYMESNRAYVIHRNQKGEWCLSNGFINAFEVTHD